MSVAASGRHEKARLTLPADVELEAISEEPSPPLRIPGQRRARP
jgi:hypothetical protein